MMRNLSIIVACDITSGFAKDNTIPWADDPAFKEDLKRFKQITSGSVCIMGRRTYEDMLQHRGEPPEGSTILPNRDCFVLSRNPTFNVKGATLYPGLRQAVERSAPGKQIFILGGEYLFTEALPWVTRIYMTIIWNDYGCNKFFPIKYLMDHFVIRSGEKFAGEHKFLMYERVKA